jgi:hypothetical protein
MSVFFKSNFMSSQGQISYGDTISVLKNAAVWSQRYRYMECKEINGTAEAVKVFAFIFRTDFFIYVTR